MIDKINIGAGRFQRTGWSNIDHASDHYHKNHIDIDVDLMSEYSFPIPDETIQAAYSSHVVEHLHDAAVLKMMSEVFRVLAPGGFFRITCPDARAAFDALSCGNEEFFNIYDFSPCFSNDIFLEKYHLEKPLRDASIYQKFLYFLAPQRCIHVNVPCEKISDEELKDLLNYYYTKVLDSITRNINEDIRNENPWMHISWWTIKKLKSYLERVGFKTIYQSEPGLSQCEEMRDLHDFDWALPRLSLYIEAVK